MADKKKSRKSGSHVISTALFAAMGFVLGLAIIAFTEWQFPEGISTFQFWAILLFMFVSLFLHIVIHESGHLIFGRLSGYSFSSFRIGSFMILKENGKLVSKQLKIAGTGGQCLMVPPEMVDGKFPVFLYNLGGSIMNLAVSLIFLIVFTVISKDTLAAVFCFLMIGMGWITSLSNGIPLRTSAIGNDGYNALSLRKNKDAMRAFWVQLKVNEQISKGLRLKDMPDAWFQMPSDDAMKNNLVATLGVYACNRLMDQHRFDEADALMAHMLEMQSGMVGNHRKLIICARIYNELIPENRPAVLASFYTKDQKKYMKAMRTFPSVIRTEYAHAVLAEKDPVKAAKVMEAFEKVTKTYPYPNEINSERELIQIAAEKASI